MTTKASEVTKQHQPVGKSNGCTVCSCGFGDAAKFVPFYGAGSADILRRAQSRDAFFQHLRGIATIR